MRNRILDLSVIAPCFNKKDNLGILVDRLQSVFSDIGTQGEIVLVDDGSTDRMPLEAWSDKCGPF